MAEFGRNFSRGVLIQLLMVIALAAALIFASVDFLVDIYLRRQMTQAGLLINGAIVTLFLLGMGRVTLELFRYMGEEEALRRFVAAREEGARNPDAGIGAYRLICQRYHTLLTLHRERAPINHAALASALVARESTRISLPRFINHILILTGVFGTIVSLSIALVGASNVLDGTDQELGNMGLVIHGMSTALSTTMTAIVCYLIFGYFYLKLTDAQTRVLSGIEQATSLYLMPQFAHTPDHLLQHITGLVRQLQAVADSMRTVQSDYEEAGSQLHSLMATLNLRVKPVSEDLKSIKRLLRDGFRLPEGGG